MGGPVWYLAATDSTMNRAREKALQGKIGCAVFAGWQSQGRGRFYDRVWQAPADTALTGTLVLKPALGFAASIRAALAVCLLIEGLGLRCKLKWPNDVLISDKKVAGILVENCGPLHLCGIGINVRQEDFGPGPFRRQPTSLLLESLVLEPRELIPSLLYNLHKTWNWPSERAKDEASLRLWKLGQNTVFNQGLREIEGTIKGLADDGSLLVENSQGSQRLYSAD